MKEFELNSPENTKRVHVVLRHSIAPSKGNNATKTLSKEGYELCKKVVKFYSAIIYVLISAFGEMVVTSSERPRAFLTAFLLTEFPNISKNPVLNPKITIGNVPAPTGSEHKNFLAHYRAEGMTDEEIISMLLKKPELIGAEKVKAGIRSIENFVRKSHLDANVIFSVRHEPDISFLAKKYGASDDELVCRECQGFIFWLDEKNKIIGTEKLAPHPTTVKRKKNSKIGD